MIKSILAAMAVVFALIFLILFAVMGLTPHTVHIHDAQHVDDPGAPELSRGTCYSVSSYDDVAHGFLWLQHRTEHYFSGVYCLKDITSR